MSDSWRSRESGENFPVALAVLPRRYRDDLHAIYAFARAVDELGDRRSAASTPRERVERLTRVDEAVGAVWAGEACADPIIRAAHRAAVAHGISAEPFQRLVHANLQDQRTHRYESYEDLLGYCRLSANPVGEMVLGIFEQSAPETVALSDQVCTALQLLEHWQDVAEDRRNGRVYLPQEDLRVFGVVDADLDQPTASPAVRALMSFEIERASALLTAGEVIVGRLHGWARPCVAGFVAGGRATVTALRRTHGDVLGRSAQPSKPAQLSQLAVLLAVPRSRAGRGGGGSA
jgi:squalene synthase HpnC